MTRLNASFCLLLLALLVSCKNGSSDPDSNKIDSLTQSPFATKMPKLSSEYKRTKQEIVSAFYTKYFIKNRVNGSFLVAKNGQVIFEHYQGYSRIETKTPITETTPIHIASVSKVLTAALVLRLIDQGKLQLNQNVNTLLNPFPYEGITITMLLNHRSGLPNYAYFSDDRKIWDHSKTLTNQDVLDLMNQYRFPMYFPANKRFAYCNTNYAMLALIIEKVTGLNYRDAMKKLLFEPLKMNDTFVLDVEKDKDNVSQTYKGNNVRLAFDHLDGIYGDKNIYSTPRDLLKFDIATYSPNFLSPEITAAAYKGYSYEHRGTRNYGLGIRMYEWDTGQKMYYHNGWWHGNTSAYVKLKKDTVVIFALSNKYTKATYQSWKLAPSFGDYPVKLDKGDQGL